eukprot:653944-Hanusia_phi.AAC.2
MLSRANESQSHAVYSPPQLCDPMPIPSAPTGVVTTGTPWAQASRILPLTPAPNLRGARRTRKLPSCARCRQLRKLRALLAPGACGCAARWNFSTRASCLGWVHA